jgi:hypothetical protein
MEIFTRKAGGFSASNHWARGNASVAAELLCGQKEADGGREAEGWREGATGGVPALAAITDFLADCLCLALASFDNKPGD